jgi:uncharacterized protein (DUF433 family)
MGGIVRSIRVPQELDGELQREFRRRGIREWSTGVLTLLEEAVRISRAPGIAFVDSLSGRRAAIAGTATEVWEVVASWKSLEGDTQRLRASYEWLSEAQLRAALNYYDLYPTEIEERLALEKEWTPERVRREFPFTAGPAAG